MKKLSIVLSIYFFTTLLNAADSQTGSTLHQNNCIACHAAMTGGDGSVLYTRSDRKVTSMDALAKQINRCQTSLGLNWSTEQHQSVQQYLNKLFYKF